MQYLSSILHNMLQQMLAVYAVTIKTLCVCCLLHKKLLNEFCVVLLAAMGLQASLSLDIL